MSAKIISRSKGQSAIAAAAYRSGERLRDEQADEQKFYQARRERIIHTEVMTPADAPEWAHDRGQLWNHAERAEKRRDAQLAREFEIALPHELTEQQREYLVKDFAREAFTRKGYAVDFAIHAPDKDSDARNHHAHIMVTMRTLGPEGFAAKKDRSMNGPKERREQLETWRGQWERLANRHLERHGHKERIDCRTLSEQGIEREPTTHLGYAAIEMTERGAVSDRMEQHREIVERNELRAEIAASDKEIRALENEIAREEKARAAAAARQAEAIKQPEPTRSLEDIQAAQIEAAKQAEALRQSKAERAAAEASRQAKPPAPTPTKRERSFEDIQAAHRAAEASKRPAAHVPEPVKEPPRAPVAAPPPKEWAKDAMNAASRGVDAGGRAAGRMAGFAEKAANAPMNFLSSLTDTRPKAAFSLDPEERRQQNRAMIEARNAAEAERRAIYNMERDLESGRGCSPADIKLLTPNHQEQLALFGDGYVQKMVEELRAEERRKRDERERER